MRDADALYRFSIFFNFAQLQLFMINVLDYKPIVGQITYTGHMNIAMKGNVDCRSAQDAGGYKNTVLGLINYEYNMHSRVF